MKSGSFFWPQLKSQKSQQKLYLASNLPLRLWKMALASKMGQIKKNTTKTHNKVTLFLNRPISKARPKRMLINVCIFGDFLTFTYPPIFILLPASLIQQKTWYRLRSLLPAVRGKKSNKHYFFRHRARFHKTGFKI